MMSSKKTCGLMVLLVTVLVTTITNLYEPYNIIIHILQLYDIRIYLAIVEITGADCQHSG